MDLDGIPISFRPYKVALSAKQLLNKPMTSALELPSYW